MSIIGDFRCHCLHPVGEGRLGKQQVEVDYRFKAADDTVSLFTAFSGKFSQNPFNFFFFLGLQHSDFVVSLDYCRRFNEVGRTAARGIMHHTGNFTPVFRFDRHNKTSVAHGDDRVLQILLVGRRTDHLIHFFADFQFRHPDFTPDSSQFRGSIVVQCILADNSRRDFPFKGVVQIQS